MTPPTLLSVPNFSEGRDRRTIAALGRALAGEGGQDDGSRGGPERAAAAIGADRQARRERSVRLLDVHSDPDHHRSVFTLAARQGELAGALLRGAGEAVARIDVMGRGEDPGQAGQHPHVGALDVAPIVYLDAASRGAACAEALVLADRIGHELEVPVFLYGELTQTKDGGSRTRADLRRGGVAGLAERMGARAGRQGDGGEQPPHTPDGGQPPLAPDFGPPRLHPTAGATLVAAREPLVAFNLQLAQPATLADARAVAALIREGGEEGLRGVRAIGVALGSGLAQVSTNVERPLEVALAEVVEAVARHHRIAGAELVGLAPAAALEGFPPDVPLPGFDPARHLIENALRC